MCIKMKQLGIIRLFCRLQFNYFFALGYSSMFFFLNIKPTQCAGPEMLAETT